MEKRMPRKQRHPARLTYTIDEAAALLGVGRWAAYTAAKDGTLPTIRLGRLLVVPKAALDRLLEPPQGQAQP